VTWDHPQNEKASRDEPKSLGGFTFKTLRVALFHGHLKKVRVVLKVYRKTKRYGILVKNRLFQGRCPDPLFT
jgi:hypothetical protein